ncbi:hypothetical protein QBC32DRAFT_120704 [Pseudoneurospora amorphoporcata]|uniref:Uncharacterized protein n=1 Tax=Pseudoneurospora amorphoporcata TaxID=241081 RepID=A0AAN6NY92_9PEZI|nr:hypothetical protein QBC32DRAFT_120704 [Pseudoneurospora amorphoporcata]
MPLRPNPALPPSQPARDLPPPQRPIERPIPPPKALALRGSLDTIRSVSSEHNLVPPRVPEKRIAPTPPSRPASTILVPAPSTLPPLQEYHSGFSEQDAESGSGPNKHHRGSSFPNLIALTFGTGNQPASSSSEQPDSSSPGGFADWLNSSGSAAAEALGMAPTLTARSNKAADGQSSSSLTGSVRDGDTSMDKTPTRSRRSGTNASQFSNRSSMHEPSTPKGNVTSRLISAISSKFTPGPAPSGPAVDDELCNLDIEAALFPPGAPTDTSSPAAYKNLQANAIGLLTKMQAAYRERVVAVRDLEAEKSAQRDEIEAAETRAQHLKMQLEGMARKASEHEQAIQKLMDELAFERSKFRPPLPQRTSTIMSECSVVSEDLGVDADYNTRRKWRESASTIKTDYSYSTDTDSVAESESVFSARCRSPVIPGGGGFESGTISIVNSPAPSVSALQRNVSVTNKRRSMGPPPPVPTTPKPKIVGTQMSAFQKIIRGIAPGSDGNGCANCMGQDASMAWDTVGLLRDENRHLKERVGELEVAVEGCLDLVNGIGL